MSSTSKIKVLFYKSKKSKKSQIFKNDFFDNFDPKKLHFFQRKFSCSPILKFTILLIQTDHADSLPMPSFSETEHVRTVW